MLLSTAYIRTRRFECVRIEDYSNSHRWTSVPGTIVGTWRDSNGIEVLDLVASLPTGERMRCFRPGYGIEPTTRITFCFECNNALFFLPPAASAISSGSTRTVSLRKSC
ncbi:hypothetical protein SAMN05216276_105357 [Streptosporangium subroseum]|uniref:Uncharacterized protein n=1 Tax=Streptosporangium subroseum TaxID=106412 RepID=A0A239N978_9ACTN|nr:hypothetical protein SAMN05216276_105357 [Streptosporangium subroseum]